MPLDGPPLREQIQLWQPRPTVADWSEDKIIIPRGGEGKPGPLRWESWQRFILDLVPQARRDVRHDYERQPDW